MALLSSVNVLCVRVFFLCTIAFFCFKDVSSILDNGYFLVVTQAMNLPSLTLSPYSAQLGLVGLLFILQALGDLLPLLESNTTYFASVVPVRLLVFFVVAAISYLSESNLYLHNNAVFNYCFIEIWLNFLILSALREEKNSNFASENQFMREDEAEEDPVFISTAQQIEDIALKELDEAEEEQ